MTFRGDCPSGRSQDFTLPRRGFLQKIVENILKMGERKFSDGKVKLQTLLNQFEEKGK
jgi:hypothetical protein